MKKRAIIVIPGARYPRSAHRPLQWAIVNVFGLFNVVPDYSDTDERWIEALRTHGHEVIRFQWSGITSISSVRTSAERLAALIRENGPVTIISCSLGTHIALLAAENLGNLSKIISLCGVYRRTPTPFPVIDIRSVDDRFANTLQTLLNAFHRQKQKTTITLEGMRHDEFSNDTTVPKGRFAGRRISELLSDFFVSDPL